MNCNSLIVANWKMNKNIAETEKFFDELNSKSIKSHHKLVVCPPFTSLHIAKIKTNKTDISIGAQNCFYEDKGAFTGEVSASMLANMNIEYVIVGHSERRDYFKETNTVINKKIHAILKNKMKAILCVGEKLDVRSQGKAIEFVIPDIIAHPDLFLKNSKTFNQMESEISHMICKSAEKYDIPLEINLSDVFEKIFYRDRKFNDLSISEARKEINNVRYPNANFWKVASNYNVKVLYGIDAHHKGQIMLFDKLIQLSNEIIGNDIIKKLQFINEL